MKDKVYLPSLPHPESAIVTGTWVHLSARLPTPLDHSVIDRELGLCLGLRVRPPDSEHPTTFTIGFRPPSLQATVHDKNTYNSRRIALVARTRHPSIRGVGAQHSTPLRAQNPGQKIKP